MAQLAIGMIEVEGVASLIVAADAVVKTADVQLLGWDSIGGFTTLFFSGSTADVDASLQRGQEAAREVREHVVAAAMTQPEPDSLRHITVAIDGDGGAVAHGALGLIETQGYGIQVTNADAMVVQCIAKVDIEDEEETEPADSAEPEVIGRKAEEEGDQ